MAKTIFEQIDGTYTLQGDYCLPDLTLPAVPIGVWEQRHRQYLKQHHRIDAKPTMTVVRSMLEEAGRNILITGYSLSSYFSELTDTIIGKSQRGLFVKFFINNIEKQPDADKLLRYKGRFLQIYDYSNDEDKMAALHAKVISVDMKQTLITSANLSYHGQQGNIELGALIESERTAKQLDEVMTQLIFKKVFKQV